MWRPQLFAHAFLRLWPHPSLNLIPLSPALLIVQLWGQNELYLKGYGAATSGAIYFENTPDDTDR